jgi:electron transport complex protein RnfD
MRPVEKTLELRTSPHIASGASVERIMREVVLALLPVVVFSVWLFGLAALVTLVAAVLACLLTEQWLCRAAGRPSTLGDWSIAVTGLIYGLTLPPGLPVWIVIVGGIIAVGIGKFLFGGLGYNAFNPALVGRAFLQAAFPVAMTSWLEPLGVDRFTRLPVSTLTFPFASPVYDSVTAATPLAAMKFSGEITATADLLTGITGGSLGETSALLLIAGGVYLAFRRIINWRIPAGILATVLVLTGSFHLFDPNVFPSPLPMLFAGGLMLGAFFMATDMVASPMTSAGTAIYGVLIGTLVVVVRLWGGLPEGVMYAILIANAVAPHIDNFVRPRVYGSRQRGAS